MSIHRVNGLIFDSKLFFVRREKINITRRWIGIIRHLRSYVPIKSLDQVYKIHIRSYLNHCDIMYHAPTLSNDCNSSLSLNYKMDILKRTQYQAAQAITSTWIRGFESAVSLSVCLHVWKSISMSRL